MRSCRYQTSRYMCVMCNKNEWYKTTNYCVKEISLTSGGSWQAPNATRYDPRTAHQNVIGVNLPVNAVQKTG